MDTLNMRFLSVLFMVLVCTSQAVRKLSHGKKDKNGASIPKRQSITECDPTSRYRRPDGQCNNLKNPKWGSITSNLVRLLPAEYRDGVSSPRTQSVTGGDLPTARNVSMKAHAQSDARADITLMVMQWGQFVDHDMVLTPPSKANCTCQTTDPECFNIPLVDDEYFSGRDCMECIRSAGVLETDQFNRSVRQQINALTAYLDGSNVYGSSDEELVALRDKDGLLKDKTYNNEDGLLPENSNSAACMAEPGEYCFLAGEKRVNEHPGLVAIHTIFMRQHNKIADRLRRNTNWSDEKVFQETRKIIEAIMQHITYDEFLPAFMSPEYIKNYQLNEDVYKYVDTDQPDISNAFATAAFRYGHALIPEAVTLSGQLFEFKNMFFSPTTVLNSFDPLTGSLVNENSMALNSHFSHSVSRHLFETEDGNGFDLVSLNIQRGRDHGLPSYNQYRQICNLTALTSLTQLFPNNSEAASVYQSIEDVDLFTGGLSEAPADGGLLGPTFSCILAIQFKKLKQGDRFFYLNKDETTGFSDDQISEIQKMSLSKVVCSNSENNVIQENIFLPESKSNPKKSCRDLPNINLDKWTGSNGGGGGSDDGGKNGGKDGGK